MARSVRSPAVAGTFYPGNRAALTAAVDRYLADAAPPQIGKVRAIIAPHAGYIYSGPTAGYAFGALQRHLPPGEATIYLLGPAHRVWFDDVSTGDFAAFATPLGEAPVNQAITRELWSSKSYFNPLPAAHHGEHCLEVEIPFIQRMAPQFSLVPLLFGATDPQAVGEALVPRVADDPTSRLVVSSDLSHFNDYQTAQRLDQAFLQRVIEGDKRAVARDRNGACGGNPIVALMEIADQLGWTPHLLDYRNSGDTAGDKQRVVGYAAVAYATSDS